ncbi:hypothetical protein SAMN04487884_12713 [Butyrivibrio fibrisolvens]|uniref:DUF4869 domain-containing protein n=1 Tax=Butyrivibrio fibrisolvens TaxID=831 RepID=A0A1H9W4J9_BUTFI|nr:hypothetical protein [Butyrivibrio fibrisolvens]SES28808.1 hypothetical protein SAMN04487884_12713 [Butyrivibrio fibrisolvens]
MIRIYNRAEGFFELDNILIDVERFFDISIPASEIDDIGKLVMEKIDGAHFVDQSIGTIKTPYGITSYRNLSTGCKSVLDYIYLTKHPVKYKEVKAVDFTESGWNALDCLFDVISNGVSDKLGIIIRHDDGLYNCKSHTMLFNDEVKIESMKEFYL